MRERSCRFGPMRYFAADDCIGAALEHFGEFSPAEASLLVSLLSPGDIAIDAGAHVGCFTIPMARRVGPQGRILAFEPQAAVFELLGANLSLNGLCNVDLRCAALGATAGRAAIRAPDYDRPGNFGDVGLLPEGRGEPVPVTTIDALGLPACRLIKADIQGMERALLLGARDTLARHRPLLYLENDRHDGSRALLQLLQDLGYHAY
ncbi:MAG: FkbM family methyltransferase [Rhodocyclaceae bacterium]|nr:FkbM family methyltransferase [Rhodocyclaceae bacterium]